MYTTKSLERWSTDYRDGASSMHVCGATCRDPHLGQVRDDLDTTVQRINFHHLDARVSLCCDVEVLEYR